MSITFSVQRYEEVNKDGIVGQYLFIDDENAPEFNVSNSNAFALFSEVVNWLNKEEMDYCGSIDHKDVESARDWCLATRNLYSKDSYHYQLYSAMLDVIRYVIVSGREDYCVSWG